MRIDLKRVKQSFKVWVVGLICLCPIRLNKFSTSIYTALILKYSDCLKIKNNQSESLYTTNLFIPGLGPRIHRTSMHFSERNVFCLNYKLHWRSLKTNKVALNNKCVSNVTNLIVEFDVFVHPDVSHSKRISDHGVLSVASATVRPPFPVKNQLD